MTKIFVGLREWAMPGGSKSTWRTFMLVLVGYCAFTAIFTYPAVFHIFTRPAGSTDAYEYVWEQWWGKTALLDLHTDVGNLTSLYYPQGAHHPVIWSDAYLFLLSIPLVLLSGPVLAYNVHFFASYVLTGFTTYLLCLALTRRHGASFVGGLIFALAPIRSDHASGGMLSLMLTYWLPLYVLFLIRMLKKPAANSAVLCGVFLALSALSSPLHLLHFVIPFTLVFLVYQHFAAKARLYDVQFLKSLVLTLAVAAAIVALPYLSLLQAESGSLARQGILVHSADLLGFLVPPSSQLLVERVPALAALVTRIMPERGYTVYLGFVALLLASAGVWRTRGGAKLWVILGLVGVVLALGPLLRLGGRLVEYSVAGETGFVLLPGALLTQLPLYSLIRAPGRYAEATMLSLAVLASYGFSALFQSAGRRVLHLVLGIATVLVMCVEYASYLPFPVVDLPIPDFYEMVRRDHRQYGILDVGSETLNHPGMYYQTVHGHPIVRGYIYRFPPQVKLYLRFVDQLVQPEPDIVSRDNLVQVLNQLNIGYVVLHKLYAGSAEALEPYLSQEIGPPVYEDEQIAAFAVPASEPTEAQGIPLVALGEKWHSTEYNDGVPARWMPNDATLYVKAATEGSYQLELVVHPFREPRHLEVFVNEELVEEYEVGGLQDYLTPPFVLRSDQWTTIRFHVPEGCEVPRQTMEGQEDDRCLSMLFQAVDVVPAGAGE
jgi:hypothetical protein